MGVYPLSPLPASQKNTLPYPPQGPSQSTSFPQANGQAIQPIVYPSTTPLSPMTHYCPFQCRGLGICGNHLCGTKGVCSPHVNCGGYCPIK